MLKLMIAEDERLERKALRFLLDEYFKDSIEIVGEAINGKEAIDKAELYKPDIILMDINMPVIDGLEAARIIKESNKRTEFIILTAFNQFDYAKKSITIGVNDYLLKPFLDEEFCSAVSKVVDKINTKASDENANKQLKNNYKKIIPYVEREMVTNIVYGVAMAEEQYAEYREMLGITSRKFCSIVFNPNDKKIFSESSILTIKNKLSILFSKIVGCMCLNDIVLFVFDDDLESDILSKRFENILNSLQEELKLNKEANIYAGVGYVNEELDKLYFSYKEAKLSSERKRKMDSQVKSETEISIKTELDINEMEVTICGKIINEDLDGAISELDSIIDNLMGNSVSKDFSDFKKSLYGVFKDIFENISEFTGEDISTFDLVKPLEELMGLKDILAIKRCANMVIKNITNYVSGYRKNRNVDVVEKAKKYIESNYMNEISLEELSQYVSMSTFYFSRIFSKLEGMNFRDYLIKIRMEKAKNLLRQGHSIKEVAMEVGYVDRNYFSKAFKKYTNYSPKEYMMM